MLPGCEQNKEPGTEGAHSLSPHGKDSYKPHWVALLFIATCGKHWLLAPLIELNYEALLVFYLCCLTPNRAWISSNRSI